MNTRDQAKLQAERVKNFTGLDITTRQYVKQEYFDVNPNNGYPKLVERDLATLYSISAYHHELINAPMWYHRKGISQTASGYGNKLNSGLKILFQGRQYRIYTTIWSNSGSNWFTCKGQRIYVN